MPIMPKQDASSPTYAKDMALLWKDIRALWRRVENIKPSPGGLVIVQPDEPGGVEIGQLWYDTDADIE
jgi:hypothetical protein